MLKTNKRKYDIFKMYYWHNARLVGDWGMPQLEVNCSVPEKVISFNERNSVKNPEDYWVDFS